MATGRFVTAPKAMVAMPDSAAVAVIKSLLTSRDRSASEAEIEYLRKSFGLPSLQETYSVTVSHSSLSLRSHSQVPPVWERRDAFQL